MQLYPAIDLRGGRCVRLYQGDFDRETVYGDDPISQALAFQSAGVGWLHVVDLDAARTGEPVNRDLVCRMARAVDIAVQTGGGVRSEEDAEALLSGGVARVVLGTAALERPELVARLAETGSVAVGIDARDGEVAGHGWTTGSGRSVLEVASQFAEVGVEALIVTDIGRDGTLAGPDVDGLAAVLGAVDVDVIASGGIGSLDDLRSLAAVERDGRRLEGAIAGRALYEGAFSAAEAVEVLASC